MPNQNVENENRYLLLLSCSARKFQVNQEVQAWNLYDGVVFRLVKNMQRQHTLPVNLDIIIVSAKYGLIYPDDIISYYDIKMGTAQIEQQRHSNIQFLRQTLNSCHYSTVFVCAGEIYLKALAPITDWLPLNTELIVAQYGIGMKMRQLKEWLISKSQVASDGRNS